jgi:serine/threonine-protein kinase
MTPLAGAEIPTSLSRALADRYRIERELGAGGMATVYLAHDVKHDRKVAIKVLRPELTAVLTVERFVVEIKTTAALQHPHILPLFDSGTVDGLLYYVMPYIQGETIREKLNRERQFGVDEAIRIAREVADALDYAHRHGVIHRDIKPENVLLHDGRAMVMDFGIALAVSAAAGGRMTETGLSLGTPHYMSPEQAAAEKDLTPRSDVYSLSSVLYEMLAGTPPHIGGSAHQIIMRIITDTPRPVSDLRKSVPPNVAAAIAKGLEKLPADRFESAKAFGDALAAPTFSYTVPSLDPQATSAMRMATPPAARLRLNVAMAAIALVALAIAAWAWLRPVPRPPKTSLDLTLRVPLVPERYDVVISPDGSMVAYTGSMANGQTAIFLRHLHGEPDFKMLVGTDGDGDPAFSPDNQSIVFRRGDGTLAKMSLSGGSITAILGSTVAHKPHWGTNQQIVYGGPSGVFLIPSNGGTPKELLGLGGRRPFVLPDGSGVLGEVGPDVSLYDLRTDSISIVVRNARRPAYTSNGFLLFDDEQGGLSAVPFDLKQHRVTGPAVRVLDQVASSLGSSGYSVSNNGTLVWHNGSAPSTSAERTDLLVIRGFDGRADTLRLPAGQPRYPRFSPNGRFIAYVAAAAAHANQGNVFTYEPATRTNTQITFDENNATPIWSPDGTHILYAKRDTTGRMRLHIKAADNSGADELLADVPPGAKPTAWSRDDVILYTAGRFTDAGRVMTISRKPGAKPQPYVAAQSPEDDATLSPDGKFAAYVARENGVNDVWLRDFPGGISKWKLSPSRGESARWSPDGKFVYYWTVATPLDTLLRVQVDRMPTVVPRTPVVAATIDITRPGEWDLHPDGKRFVLVVPGPSAAATRPAAADSSRYIVVLNWFTELEAAMAKPRK